MPWPRGRTHRTEDGISIPEVPARVKLMSGIDQVSVLRIKLFTTFTTNDRQAKLYIYYKG
jgi:hypothetical protein